MPDLNRYSATVTQDATLPAAQAMLHGIGLSKEDFRKPQIEIILWATTAIPNNMAFKLACTNYQSVRKQRKSSGVMLPHY